jgi:hypothetical protein
VLPELSLTELTLEVESFQPIATTLRSPAVCAEPKLIVTELALGCGTA